jgi:KRAB domain-containing zinc finger protein
VDNKHSKSSFVCPTCSRVLKSQHSLEYHVKSHDVGRQHPCTTCGKRFVTRTKLRMHANIHSGQKPYQVRPSIVICNVEE